MFERAQAVEIDPAFRNQAEQQAADDMPPEPAACNENDPASIASRTHHPGDEWHHQCPQERLAARVGRAQQQPADVGSDHSAFTGTAATRCTDARERVSGPQSSGRALPPCIAARPSGDHQETEHGHQRDQPSRSAPARRRSRRRPSTSTVACRTAAATSRTARCGRCGRRTARRGSRRTPRRTGR